MDLGYEGATTSEGRANGGLGLRASTDEASKAAANGADGSVVTLSRSWLRPIEWPQPALSLLPLASASTFMLELLG